MYKIYKLNKKIQKNMKRLKSVQTEKYTLEVLECDCGFHLGIDGTYLDQVGDFKIHCPNCKHIIDTSTIFLK